MKNKPNLRERGQALVLIAFAAVGLFAFAALAIDGSMIFSDRRHAQNAADTASLDAALAYIRLGSSGTWVDEGLDRAESNGYDNDGTRNTVAVELCSTTADPCDSLPAGADPASFIQVQITSNVNTYFARVIGITQITNRVEAVAEVVPSTYDEMFYGNAVVGLSPDDCKAVMYQGNADTTITSVDNTAGIFVMSSCPDSAFFNNSNAAQLTAPSLCAVGGNDYNPGAINIQSIKTGCTPPPSIVEPNISCSGDAEQDGNKMSPGNWSGTFPPAGVEILLSGIYCVDGNFRIAGGDSLMTEIGGDGVVIKMVGGDVRLEGNGAIDLRAPTSGDFAGLLIYLPSVPGPSNCEEIVFNGTGDFHLVGSILAPCSNVTINGTGTGVAPTGGIVGQVIGYTVDLSGTSNVSLYYDDANNWDSLTQPQIKAND
jgi:hypothetical protein